METYTLLCFADRWGNRQGYITLEVTALTFCRRLRMALTFSEQRTIHKNAHGVQCIGVCLQNHRLRPSLQPKRTKGTGEIIHLIAFHLQVGLGGPEVFRQRL